MVPSHSVLLLCTCRASAATAYPTTLAATIPSSTANSCYPSPTPAPTPTPMFGARRGRALGMFSVYISQPSGTGQV